MDARRCTPQLLLLTVFLIVVPGYWLTTTQLPAQASSTSGTHRASALNSGITMQLTVGYNGNFRQGAWVPLRIRISNPGPTFSGTLRYDGGAPQSSNNTSPENRADYTRSIVMPQGGIKQFTLYVPGAALPSQVSVKLEVGGQAILEQQAVANQLGLGSLLVGVLSRNTATYTQLRSLNTLAGAQINGTTFRLTPLTLDSQPLAWDSLDVVVISDYPTSELSAEQRAALEAWVRAGGTLITIGGPTANATLSGLPDPLRLMEIGAPTTLTSLPMTSGSGGVLPAGVIVAASGKVRAGVIALDAHGVRTATGATQLNTPLVVTKQLGLGTVCYSAIDPTLGPLATWRGVDAYWQLLAGQARSAAATETSALADTQNTSNGNGGNLDTEIDNVSPPSVTLFLVLLGVYVAILVPLNFVILERLRRRDWSWVTLPVLAMLLVAATFGSAVFSRGRNVRTSIVSVLYLTSKAPAVVVQHYVGLFSPLAGDYTIEHDPNHLGAALYSASQSGASGTPGNQSQVGLDFAQDSGVARLPSMNMWSSRNVTFTGLTTFSGGLDGTVQATSDGHFAGVLTNTTDVLLHSVVLSAVGGSYVGLGDMPPGQSKRVNLLSGNAPSSAATSQSIGDYYGVSAQALSPVPATRPLVAALTMKLPLSALNAYRTTNVRLLADANTIPTNPDETAMKRFQMIAAQVLPATSLGALGPLTAVYWTGQAIDSLAINGDQPGRQDTDLLVQTIPIALGAGSFVINPNSIPARLAGSDQDVQQGSNFGGAGMTISNGSAATFVAQLPLPASPGQHLLVRTLALDVQNSGAGGGLSSQTAALYDWQAGKWQSIDISSGSLVLPHAARFVSAAGIVRIQVSAQDASLTISDANTGIAVGATGTVQ